MKPEGSQSPQGQTPRPQGRVWQGSAPGHLGGTPGAEAAIRRERPAACWGEGGGGEGKEEENKEAGSQSHPLKDVGGWGIWARGERLNSGDTWGQAGEPGCSPGTPAKGLRMEGGGS